jgi:hypothetical protein
MALIPGTLPTGTKYPNSPQSLLDTFASYLTAPEAKKNRPTVSVYTPSAGATVIASPNGLDETIYLDHSGTIATLTFEFPSNSNSVTGQTLRLFSRSAVTALTVTLPGSVVIRGTAITALTASQCVEWQKVASDTWIRIQ